jgi:hypothetical protein
MMIKIASLLSSTFRPPRGQQVHTLRYMCESIKTIVSKKTKVSKLASKRLKCLKCMSPTDVSWGRMGGDGGRVAIHDDSADFSWSWAIIEKCHAIMEKKSITGERPFSRLSRTESLKPLTGGQMPGSNPEPQTLNPKP